MTRINGSIFFLCTSIKINFKDVLNNYIEEINNKLFRETNAAELGYFSYHGKKKLV
jgi:hypothetical protein